MSPLQKFSPALPRAWRRRRAAALVAAFALVAAGGALPAVADEPGATSRVIRTDSYLGGGLVVTQAEVGTLSFADCTSGYTCIWDSPLYIGVLFQFNQPGQVIVLPSSATIASYANKRNRRSTFYESNGGGGKYVCAPPNTQNQAVAGWLVGARSLIQNSTATSC